MRRKLGLSVLIFVMISVIFSFTQCAKNDALIPRQVLFGNPDKASLRISSNHQMISYRAPLDGVMTDCPVCPKCDRLGGKIEHLTKALHMTKTTCPTCPKIHSVMKYFKVGDGYMCREGCAEGEMVYASLSDFTFHLMVKVDNLPEDQHLCLLSLPKPAGE